MADPLTKIYRRTMRVEVDLYVPDGVEVPTTEYLFNGMLVDNLPKEWWVRQDEFDFRLVRLSLQEAEPAAAAGGGA